MEPAMVDMVQAMGALEAMVVMGRMEDHMEQEQQLITGNNINRISCLFSSCVLLKSFQVYYYG